MNWNYETNSKLRWDKVYLWTSSEKRWVHLYSINARKTKTTFLHSVYSIVCTVCITCFMTVQCYYFQIYQTYNQIDIDYTTYRVKIQFWVVDIGFFSTHWMVGIIYMFTCIYTCFGSFTCVELVIMQLKVFQAFSRSFFFMYHPQCCCFLRSRQVTSGLSYSASSLFWLCCMFSSPSDHRHFWGKKEGIPGFKESWILKITQMKEGLETFILYELIRKSHGIHNYSF